MLLDMDLAHNKIPYTLIILFSDYVEMNNKLAIVNNQGSLWRRWDLHIHSTASDLACGTFGFMIAAH